MPQFKQAIAFSLYGKDPRYTEGMIKNVIIAPHVFQGWDVVIYHDNSVPFDILRSLTILNCRLINCSGRKEAGHFWRFLINDDAERWISRDADSRLNVRDLAAVNEWIASGKKWHVIKDDIAHFKHPVLAGTWGGFNTGVNMQAKMDEWKQSEEFNDDQEFIKEKLWPQMQSDVIVHDIDKNPIKHDRVGHYYVGQVWNKNEQPL